MRLLQGFGFWGKAQGIVIFIFIAAFFSCGKGQKTKEITIPQISPYIDADYNGVRVDFWGDPGSDEERPLNCSSLLFTNIEDEPEIEKMLQETAMISGERAFSFSDITDRTVSIVYGDYGSNLPIRQRLFLDLTLNRICAIFILMTSLPGNCILLLEQRLKIKGNMNSIILTRFALIRKII
jgi:hypothetical protein